jgi:hypothetical protein
VSQITGIGSRPAYSHGIKGTQMRIKLIATAVVAASLLEQLARAADTVCNGVWYQNRDRDIVTDDFTKNAKA